MGTSIRAVGPILAVAMLCCEPVEVGVISGTELAGEYATCDGRTLYPDTCARESCVSTGRERRVYDLWRQTFMGIHRLSDERMRERVIISDVTISEGPAYVVFRVDYVFVIDWVRSRQSEAVRLGRFPLSESPSEEAIKRALELAIESSEEFNIPSVKELRDVARAVHECRPGMRMDFCQIDFQNVSGKLLLGASAVERAPSGANLGSCMGALVDLATGMLMACNEGPCGIH